MSVEHIGKSCIEAICCLLGWSCHSLILSSDLLSLSSSLSSMAKSSRWKLHWLLNVKPPKVPSMSLSLSHITIIIVLNRSTWLISIPPPRYHVHYFLRTLIQYLEVWFDSRFLTLVVFISLVWQKHWATGIIVRLAKFSYLLTFLLSNTHQLSYLYIIININH